MRCSRCRSRLNFAERQSPVRCSACDETICDKCESQAGKCPLCEKGDPPRVTLSLQEVDALAMMLWESGSPVWLDIRGLLPMADTRRFVDICQHGHQTWHSDPTQLPPWRQKSQLGEAE